MSTAAPASGVPPETIAAAAAAVRAHFHANRPGLGSFPGTAARIVQILHSRTPDLNKLVTVLGQDAAVAARLLQVANSPINARGDEVQSVRAAVLRLGQTEVAQLALGVAGNTLFVPESRAEHALFPERWQQLFHESMTAAFAAGWLSMTARAGHSDQAFLVGMLHDVGKPVALRALAQLAIAGTADASAVAQGADEVVEQVHVEIGVALTEAWGLPGYLRVAAARHHDDEVPADPELAELHVVRVIDGLRAARAGSLTPALARTMQASAAALHLDARTLAVAATEYAGFAANVSALFGVDDPVACVRAPRAA